MTPDPTTDSPPEPREVSGLTTGLVLSYVEREGGRSAVGAVLAGAGLSGREESLRDEHSWFADRRRVDLFEAAAEVLDDPGVARKIGAASLDFNLGTGLKLSLRALGTPRLVYSNIARANSKFTSTYEMTVLQTGDGKATIRNVCRINDDHHACDCDYNIGMLSVVPEIFGLPAAEVKHRMCVGRGAEECRYEVSWEESRSPLRWALGGAGLLAGTAVIVPSALPFGVAGAALMGGVAIKRGLQERFEGIHHLEKRVGDETEAAALMMTSLKELVSELNLDEVLGRITAHAHSSVGGAEFALLVREEGRMQCRSSSDPLSGRVGPLERWASQLGAVPVETITVDDLGAVDELAPLAAHRSDPLRSMCAAPLEVRGQTLGVLIALFPSARGVLPRDIVQLESYATQAAIALNNARLYEAQQELATRDPLTGLLNHRQFHEVIEAEIARVKRSGGRLGVAMFDLDRFKAVNDHYGHARGDAVLRGVAEKLSNSARASDSAFRVGGDEFAMILPEATLEQARLVAARAAAAVAGSDAETSLSWGVASWPDSAVSKDELIVSADAAMYELKAAGKRSERTILREALSAEQT